MENTIQDAIVKEFTTTASKERVFQAISDPSQMVKWFPDSIEGDIKKDERASFTFNGHGVAPVYIVAVEPNSYFAYRWVPGSIQDANVGKDILERPTTLVEFRLEEVEGGTKVTVTESGFSAIPADVVEKAFAQNTQGWGFMLGRLEKYLS
jgi:uncharacterized protein YndB with AHSA1/START domain